MQICDAEACQLVVVSGSVWQSTTVDCDTAVTLIATLSEDPANWTEVMAYWPRYRTDAVPQNLDDLQFEIVQSSKNPLQHPGSLDDGGWLFIDLDEKRIVSSPTLDISNRDRVFDLFLTENPHQRWPLSIHLPPWWELVEGTELSTIYQARSKPLVVPQTNRNILFGKPLSEFIAQQVLAKRSSQLSDCLAQKDLRALHSMTVEIHRDWLMTPREDLSGQMPRQLLHGAHDWISRVIEGQALRAQQGCPLIAAPTDVQGFDEAAMGSEEVVIYFELCRYLIGRGWEWLGNPERSKSSTEFSPDCMMDSVADLVAFLDQAKEEFLTSPFEGGSSPNFILQCSRRRVPRSSEIAIEGIEEQERSEHTNDCDCPICLMLADGDFGPSFTSLDGYHLELDEEFAFSLFETYQQWQEESLFHCDDEDSDDSDPASEADDMDADADADDDSESDNSEGQGPTANQSRADEHLPIDEFASAWDGIRSTEPLQGDTLGHIKLAFMLAEIVSHLQSRKVQPQIIRGLNAAFVRYRQASDRETIAAKATLVERLELLTVRYPQLVPRIADFQSHLDLTVNRTVP